MLLQLARTGWAGAGTDEELGDLAERAREIGRAYREEQGQLSAAAREALEARGMSLTSENYEKAYVELGGRPEPLETRVRRLLDEEPIPA